MGTLLGTVVSSLTEPILACTEFEEEQTHAIYRLIKTLAEVEDVFDPPLAASASTPGWEKLLMIGKLMDLGLEAIYEADRGNEFHALSQDELRGLLSAIFQDSPTRAAILASI
ncbi:unnamed protein product [Discosporangium mesarthrocarpum]